MKPNDLQTIKARQKATWESGDFFRHYYGPTLKAFDLLAPGAQSALHADLVALQEAHNSARTPDTTVPPPYNPCACRRANRCKARRARPTNPHVRLTA